MKKLLLLIGAILIGTFLWYRSALAPVDAASEQSMAVTVAQGMSSQRIAALLEEQKLITSPRVFLLYAKLHGAQGKLKAGTFQLSPAQSVPELIAVLEEGKTQEQTVTIPEGFTVHDIDALMAEKGFLEKNAVLACAQTCAFSAFDFLPLGNDLAERGGRVEGYLFPDTYNIDPVSVTAESFLEMLLGNFRVKVIDSLGGEIAEGRTLHEIVTMASLVEEEAITDEERPVVSGILWKREEADMGLGVDATVRYILSKPSADITLNDLAVDSPYNTRKYRGLPPGPIANPGLQSIHAALEPQESPYWYYLHDGSGQIHYAETNDGHNANRARYLR